MELIVRWHGGRATGCTTVEVEVDGNVTCVQLAVLAAESLELGARRKGAWYIVEQWMGCGKYSQRLYVMTNPVVEKLVGATFTIDLIV